MSGPALAFLLVDLLGAAALLACLIALARQAGRLADAVRRFAEDARPDLRAIADGGRGVGGGGC